MPGYLVDAGTKVMCAHAGEAAPAAPAPRVTVMGQPVATQPVPYLVAGCPFQSAPGVPTPCVTASWLTGALRVKVMGQPVLLSSSAAVATPTGAPLTIFPGQTRVKGI